MKTSSSVAWASPQSRTVMRSRSLSMAANTLTIKAPSRSSDTRGISKRSVPASSYDSLACASTSVSTKALAWSMSCGSTESVKTR